MCDKNKMLEMTDEELLLEIRSQQGEAINILLERYKMVVKRVGKKLFLQGGDFDDLIQEGMIGLVKAIQDYNIGTDASFYTFANICISRQMYTAVEAANRKKHLPLNSYISISAEHEIESKEEIGSKYAMPIEQANPETLYLGQEYEKAFTEKLMSNLSDLEKEVLLHHIMGMEYTEIAELMLKEPKSIDNALQRIKTKAKIVVKEMK